MLKFFIILAGGITFLYVGLAVFLFIIQRRLLFFPTHRDSAAKGHAEFRPLVSLAPAKEGGPTTNSFLGYWRPVEHPKRAILFFHGNGGEALDREWIGELIPEEDFAVVLAEYPGYGAKTGEASEESIFASALNVFDDLAGRWQIPITVVGESLGTGVASYVASQRKIDRLALISPFYGAVDVAATRYRFIPVRILMKDRFESSKYLSKIKIPLHIIHGTLDDVVPVESAKKLFESYPYSEKTFTEIPGYGHNNIYSAIVDSPFADNFRAFVRGE